MTTKKNLTHRWTVEKDAWNRFTVTCTDGVISVFTKVQNTDEVVLRGTTLAAELRDALDDAIATARNGKLPKGSPYERLGSD